MAPNAVEIIEADAREIWNGLKSRGIASVV
jgi:hypothetical protein